MIPCILYFWYIVSNIASMDCSSGTSLTLTGCLVHGYGVYLYLVDEGFPTGAGWTIEVVAWLRDISNLPPYPFYILYIIFYFWNQLPTTDVPALLIAQAMRSIDKAYAICRSKNQSFPPEFPGLLHALKIAEWHNTWKKQTVQEPVYSYFYFTGSVEWKNGSVTQVVGTRWQRMQRAS